jgi:hypothetical protein
MCWGGFLLVRRVEFPAVRLVDRRKWRPTQLIEDLAQTLARPSRGPVSGMSSAATPAPFRGWHARGGPFLRSYYLNGKALECEYRNSVVKPPMALLPQAILPSSHWPTRFGSHCGERL